MELRRRYVLPARARVLRGRRSLECASPRTDTEMMIVLVAFASTHYPSSGASYGLHHRNNPQLMGTPIISLKHHHLTRRQTEQCGSNGCKDGNLSRFDVCIARIYDLHATTARVVQHKFDARVHANYVRGHLFFGNDMGSLKLAEKALSRVARPLG